MSSSTSSQLRPHFEFASTGHKLSSVRSCNQNSSVSVMSEAALAAISLAGIASRSPIVRRGIEIQSAWTGSLPCFLSPSCVSRPGSRSMAPTDDLNVTGRLRTRFSPKHRQDTHVPLEAPHVFAPDLRLSAHASWLTTESIEATYKGLVHDLCTHLAKQQEAAERVASVSWKFELPQSLGQLENTPLGV